MTYPAEGNRPAGVVTFDQEIPDGILDAKRLEQLKKAGKVGKTTTAEETQKREAAAAKARAGKVATGPADDSKKK